MFTEAKYYSCLVPPHLANIKSDNSLFFDTLGSINFHPADKTFPLIPWSPSTHFDPYLLSTAAIIIGVARCNKGALEGSEFNGNMIIQALMQQMNAAIENKMEVALEIYQCWLDLTAHLGLIESPSLRVSPYYVPPLTPIPHFEEVVATLLFKASQAIFFQPDSPAKLSDNPLLRTLITYLDQLTGNELSKEINTQSDAASLLFRLSNYFTYYSQFFSKTEIQELSPLFTKLHKELPLVTGNWLNSFKDYLAFELDADEEVPQDEENNIALENQEDDPAPASPEVTSFILDTRTKFTNQINYVLRCEQSTVPEEIREDLPTTLPIVLLEKKTIERFLTRDSEKPTPDILKLGAQYALIAAAKKLKLTLSREAVLNLSSHNIQYARFTDTIQHHVQAFGIDAEKTKIFPHLLLRMAGINKLPEICSYAPKKRAEESSHHELYDTTIVFQMSLSPEMRDCLLEFLQKYDNSIAKCSEDCDTTVFEIDLKQLMSRILPDWYHFTVQTLRENPRLWRAYQVLSAPPVEEKYFQKWKWNINNQHNLAPNTPILELLLMQGAGISKPMKHSYILNYPINKDKNESILDVHIIFAIKEEDARLLVNNLNTMFVDIARLGRRNVRYVGSRESFNHNYVYQEVILDKYQFDSQDFQTFLANILNCLVNDTVFMKKYSRTLAQQLEEAPADSFCTIL